ncbi:MAG: hypothetical protein ACR2LU_05990, partial [Luteitalea sp.]
PGLVQRAGATAGRQDSGAIVRHGGKARQAGSAPTRPTHAPEKEQALFEDHPCVPCSLSP